MTEKLYYQNAYMTEFDAEVVSVSENNGKITAVFDKTAFYPEGGGQPCDFGEIITEDGRVIKVTDVHEKDELIYHTLSEPVTAGDIIHGRIDWARRFDHMQQHSGEHIISGIICSAYSCDNVGFHLGDESVTIDYNAEISYEQAKALEEQANRYIWENHAFHSFWPDKATLHELSYRSKKELGGAVRIAEFPGADICACYGTHVAYSGEIGLIKIASAKKYKGGTRFELYCGKRAYDFLSMNYENNKEVAVFLSAKENNTPALVKKQAEELMHAKFRLAKLEEAGFMKTAEECRGKGDILLIREELEADGVRKLADAIGSVCGGRACVFAGSGSSYKYAVIHPDTDISGFIKDLNRALSGRGGGKCGFAQGSVAASEGEIRAFFSSLSG